MPPLRDKSPKPGASSKSYGASELIELYRKAAEAQSLTVSAPLEMSSGPSGRTLSLNRRQAIWGKISGGFSPYSFTQQVRQGGAWVDGPITGATNAYEVNNATITGTQIVRLQPGFAGEDWRFRFNKCSSQACIALGAYLFSASGPAALFLTTSAGTFTLAKVLLSGVYTYRVTAGIPAATISTPAFGQHCNAGTNALIGFILSQGATTGSSGCLILTASPGTWQACTDSITLVVTCGWTDVLDSSLALSGKCFWQGGTTATSLTNSLSGTTVAATFNLPSVWPAGAHWGPSCIPPFGACMPVPAPLISGACTLSS